MINFDFGKIFKVLDCKGKNVKIYQNLEKIEQFISVKLLWYAIPTNYIKMRIIMV